MLFVVLGVAVLVLYVVAAAWMSVVARRDPGRTFAVGRFGRIRRGDVTAAQWLRRYAPRGIGGAVLLTALGLVLVSR